MPKCCSHTDWPNILLRLTIISQFPIPFFAMLRNMEFEAANLSFLLNSSIVMFQMLVCKQESIPIVPLLFSTTAAGLQEDPCERIPPTWEE